MQIDFVTTFAQYGKDIELFGTLCPAFIIVTYQIQFFQKQCYILHRNANIMLYCNNTFGKDYRFTFSSGKNNKYSQNLQYSSVPEPAWFINDFNVARNNGYSQIFPKVLAKSSNIQISLLSALRNLLQKTINFSTHSQTPCVSHFYFLL